MTVGMDVGAFRSRFATALGQLVRYGFIGAAINIACYLLYLWQTFYGLDPKTAATTAFLAGVMVGFPAHRRFSFRHAGNAHQSVVKFSCAYLTAYAANIIGLYVLVDVLHYPHQFVQFFLLVIIAAGLFLSQKFWIFSVTSALPNRG